VVEFMAKFLLARRRLVTILVLALAGGAALWGAVTACSNPVSSGGTAIEGPAGKVEAVDGSNLSRVVLSPDAARRLGIQTAQVRDAQGPGKQQRAIPYGALLYDPSGATWTYTNPETLVFRRHAVTVDSIQGDVVTLSDGPPTGTTVVTVGAAELYGTELGVGE
jgi:hypothetical protein